LTGATGPAGPDGPAGATGPAGAPGTGGFAHYLGEAFDGGIIFEIYKGSDGLEHGLIVALTESYTGSGTFLAWQTSDTLLVNANRTEDGVYNTALMTDSPAATYIASLGAGWYLPSIDELVKLYLNRYYAQKGLRAGGHTLLGSQLSQAYWSSTEHSTYEAYYLDFTYYYPWSGNRVGKTATFAVRGIRAF
jgi:hypothetical protein